MARNGTSIAMQHQILIMKSQGRSLRAIAKALTLSRNTVRAYLRSEPKVEESPAAINAVAAASLIQTWTIALDWEAIVKARAAGRTIKQLHSDHGCDGVSYWAFRRALNQRLKRTPKPALRLDHQAGEKTYVDYCDGIALVDPATGKRTKTHLFCGVLPFSGKIFAEFVFNQKSASFLSSHERMWSYFGGVTPYVVVDNLKSGVSKAHLYDPDVNPTYCEFGNHYGFAVLPARPYTPRDKAAVEAAIGVIQKTFFEEVSGRTFYALDELNLVFRAFLERLNDSVMKDYGVSRNARFAEESPRLLPLPVAGFEHSEWKDLIVHPDCHVQAHKNFYSAPFQLIGQTMRVRLTGKLVEIFTHELELVCAHMRLAGAGRYQTTADHMPPHAMQRSSFEIRSSIAKAEAIGPKTAELADLLLVQGSRPLRKLRLFQGLSRLVKDGRITREAIEFGSGQALTFRRYRLGFITDCAKSYMQRGPRPQIIAPRREVDHIHVHGEIKS